MKQLTHLRIGLAVCLVGIAATAGSATHTAMTPDPDVLQLAMKAVACATAGGDIETPRTLTLIDYSLPSTEPRLWVLDLTTGKILFAELVAHGKNTGDNLATRFSDTLESHQSSLGLFVAIQRVRRAAGSTSGAGSCRRAARRFTWSLIVAGTS
jgi:hypothetical protein